MNAVSDALALVCDLLHDQGFEDVDGSAVGDRVTFAFLVPDGWLSQEEK